MEQGDLFTKPGLDGLRGRGGRQFFEQNDEDYQREKKSPRQESVLES